MPCEVSVMIIDDNDPVVRLWHQLWIDGDDAAVTDLLTDPYVRHTTDGRQIESPTDYAQHVCTVTRHIKGTEVVVDHLNHAGDMTYVRFTLLGINLTTGKPVSIGWLAHYRTENGQLAESWSMGQTDFAWGE